MVHFSIFVITSDGKKRKNYLLSSGELLSEFLAKESMILDFEKSKISYNGMRIKDARLMIGDGDEIVIIG